MAYIYTAPKAPWPSYNGYQGFEMPWTQGVSGDNRASRLGRGRVVTGTSRVICFASCLLSRHSLSLSHQHKIDSPKVNGCSTMRATWNDWRWQWIPYCDWDMSRIYINTFMWVGNGDGNSETALWSDRMASRSTSSFRWKGAARIPANQSSPSCFVYTQHTVHFLKQCMLIQ